MIYGFKLYKNSNNKIRGVRNGVGNEIYNNIQMSWANHKPSKLRGLESPLLSKFRSEYSNNYNVASLQDCNHNNPERGIHSSPGVKIPSKRFLVDSEEWQSSTPLPL